MTFIWFFLSLHFFYYVPFLLFIIAYTRIISSDKVLMYNAIVLWAIILIADFSIVYSIFNGKFFVYYLMICYLVPLLTSLILWISGKLDILIWLICTILFSPISMPISWLFVYLATPKAEKSLTPGYGQS